MIDWINFTPEWSAPLGLAGGPLRDLGDVVVLTGPNGGGKTRYLQLLIQVWARYRKLLLRKSSLEAFGKLRERARAGTATDADVLEQSPILLHAFYSYLTHGLLPTDPIDTATGAEPLPSLRQVVSNIDGMIPQVGLRPGGIERALEHGALPRTVILKYHRVDYGYYYRDVEGGDLCRDDEVNVKSSHENEKLRRVRMFRIREELERKLDGLARLVYMQEHPRFASTHAPEIERAMGVWRLLETWLGQPLTVESPGADGYRIPIRLGAHLLTLKQLSEGQQVLLTWALTLAEHEGALRNAIVLLDEPELHLHPSAALAAIQALREHGVSQIWLATHSPPLLATFGIESLYYVHDGRIEYAGNQVEKVLDGLLGVDGRAQLRTFLVDADDLAFHAFAAQSLVPPHSVDLRRDDPQARQFRALFPAAVAGEPIHVLDYAAGKGRLARALGELQPHDHVRYYAYNDPRYTPPEDGALCRRRVAELAQSEGMFYTEEFPALTLTTAPKMHAVVLCNVLHEIPDTDWLKTFHDIALVLRDDGALLLMEDQRMGRGELPHDTGFIVLDRWALCELFSAPPEQLEPQSEDPRLTIFRIPRTMLARANTDTLVRALKKVAENAKHRLRSLRSTISGSPREGREHAYYALLLTNVMLALERYPTDDDRTK